jgi:hypothetical protein
MKSIKDIPFERLFTGMKVIIPAGKFLEKALGEIVATKFSMINGKPRKDIVIDWRNAGLQMYEQQELNSIFYNEDY